MRASRTTSSIISLIAVCLWVAGCQSLPLSTGAGFATAQPESEALDSGNRESNSFAHSSRRTFPAQGWWCGEFEEWLAPERAERGYAIVLPGVEGTSFHNISIARGLVDAEFPGAVEVRDWTTGHWPMFVYHLMALERNRREARAIAEQIVAYQDRYPGRPVSLVGHSGGAAMAVLVLESLPEDRRITQAVLLAAAIAPDHDLTTALSRTDRGITNFYSWGDVPHLVAGTLTLGTVDRKHTVSAGAGGFVVPTDVSAAGRELYATRLQQVPYRLEMVKSFNAGGHIGSTNRKFVTEWVAPRLAHSP
ncbi:MAG: hypothetical protein HY290_20480 [Planctomycetia bacterium]|nr:hypothetical protein [Planctomycetia bacterium]